MAGLTGPRVPFWSLTMVLVVSTHLPTGLDMGALPPSLVMKHGTTGTSILRNGLGGVSDLHDFFLGTSSRGGFSSHDPQRVAIGKPMAHQADSTRVRGRLWVPWRHGKRGIIREIFLGNSGNSEEHI